MSKEQTPITAEEMAKQIRIFVQVISCEQKGNSEFLEKRVAEYLEQYAQYRERKAVLEALESYKKEVIETIINTPMSSDAKSSLIGCI